METSTGEEISGKNVRSLLIGIFNQLISDILRIPIGSFEIFVAK